MQLSSLGNSVTAEMNSCTDVPVKVDGECMYLHAYFISYIFILKKNLEPTVMFKDTAISSCEERQVWFCTVSVQNWLYWHCKILGFIICGPEIWVVKCTGIFFFIHCATRNQPNPLPFLFLQFYCSQCWTLVSKVSFIVTWLVSYSSWLRLCLVSTV